ncbi:MAG: ATP-binding protein [Anaerolineales bacterium]
MGTQSITVPSQLKDINRICEAVAVAAAEAGFDERTAYACQLAVCEALENIVVHGYGPDQEGPIEATIESNPNELIINLSDRAPAFNPSDADVSPPTAPEDPPVGGLGLYILHKVMDEVRYKRDRGRNLLHLRKTLHPDPE